MNLKVDRQVNRLPYEMARTVIKEVDSSTEYVVDFPTLKFPNLENPTPLLLNLFSGVYQRCIKREIISELFC